LEEGAKILFQTFVIAILIIVGNISCNPETSVFDSDVVIYGGTSSAVIAAVQIVKMNKTVIIVSPDKHIGGMSSSGLGYTDVGNKSVIGGLAKEFYHRIYLSYQKKENWNWEDKENFGAAGQGIPATDDKNKTMWIFEPHVAEEVFEDFIKEHNIKIYRNEWLDREKGVEKEKNKILSITTLSGKKFSGRIFIDATYEGDLMAAAGISFTVGREPNNMYDETWNGVQTGVFQHGHHFNDISPISPFVIPGDSSSGTLPRISKLPPGKKGEGDKKVQAYCFRLCLTKNKKNWTPITKPENYDSSQYELLVRIYDAGWRETFGMFIPIPNLKTDVNNHGPFSFDNIGMNYDYPEASYKRRKEIIREHKNYQQGLIYFTATDPRIPKEIKTEMQKWGLAKDEFVDNGNWPYLLYIREARRMVGQYVMTDNDILGKRIVPNSIGKGSYTMDSHNVQRYITKEKTVQNEGDIGVHPEQPYSIALGSILPKENECNNLIVPVALSSSHIAYGSIRMEPVFMVLGQSAGLVTVLSIENNIEVSKLNYTLIKTALLKAGQII
jgi:hypothetical protein